MENKYYTCKDVHLNFFEDPYDLKILRLIAYCNKIDDQVYTVRIQKVWNKRIPIPLVEMAEVFEEFGRSLRRAAYGQFEN